MMRRGHHVFLLMALFLNVLCQAQFRASHIPGFTGLHSGTQAPPGIYVGDMVYIYPTSTIKGDNGDKVNASGSLTTTADLIVGEWVTNYKIFGANIGGAVLIPFIKNRIELNSFNANSGFAFSDLFLTPLSLGWHFKRADLTVGYNLYLPTGEFEPGTTGHSGLGMYANEFSLGTTVYLDQKKSWNAAGTFSLEFNTSKRDTDITVGNVGTVEGGFGKTFYKKVSGPVPVITNVGAVGYAQFKITGDSGSDIPVSLRGLKDRVFALGPEVNVFIPKPRLTLLVRYEPEFAARNRTQGQTIVISVAWVAKPLVKQQP